MKYSKNTIGDIRSVVKCNSISACLLQQEKPNYEKIMEYCEFVLEYTPENLKAHYRKGLALYHMNNFEKAIDFFHQAADIAKDSKGK